MNMRYFREQVMFDLEIQSAYKPGYQLVACSKIGCSLDLVNGPFIFQLAGLLVGNRECRMLHRMRQLKYQAQHETRHAGKDHEADQPVGKSNHINGQAYE